MSEVIYNNDRRYPGPEAYPLPDMISGAPTQAELDAQPRLFTWGELKEIISEYTKRPSVATQRSSQPRTPEEWS